MQEQHTRLLAAIKRKKAVIWDFDGVLCFADWTYGGDFEEWQEDLWKLLEKYEPSVRTRFGAGLRYYYEHTDYIVEKFGSEALHEINAHYLKKELEILPASPLNAELVALIRELGDGIEQFVWSNNQEEFITRKLDEAGIRHKFKTVVSRDKVVLAKPHPHGYEIIRKLTKIDPRDFLFVGDSVNTDMVAARQLGMEFFRYTPQILI